LPVEGKQEVWMITVTERAANALQELLATNSALPGQGVKLVPSGVNSIGMVIEAPNEGDEVILHEGEPLLIVDSRIASDLDGAELDYETGEADDPRRAGFRLRPPTA
jgi:Fe-S cluster assembly iron-binding protein IscA